MVSPFFCKQQFPSTSVIVSTLLKRIKVSLLWTYRKIDVDKALLSENDAKYALLKDFNSPSTWICIQNLNKFLIQYLLI